MRSDEVALTADSSLHAREAEAPVHGCCIPQSSAPDARGWLARRSVLVGGVGLTVEAVAAHFPEQSRPLRTLRFAFSRPERDPRTQWLIAVYREVTQSIGLGFEFVDVPAGRATLMVLSGEVDGELGRTFDYLDLYPSLIRLAEPNNKVEFAMYGCEVGMSFTDWANVRKLAWRCEYRRGIIELGQLLANQLSTKRVSSITTIEQGLRRLQLSRTDAYLDVKEAVEDFFRFSKAAHELEAGPVPRELAVVKTTTGHAYLSTANADLAADMSKALRRMKRQGLVQALLDEALQAADAAR